LPKFTRRTLLRDSSIAVSTIAISDLPVTAEGKDPGTNVFHVFAFEWKPTTSETQKAKAARDIAAFQGKIPGLLETHVGENISPRGKGYTFGGIMRFKDKSALDAYVLHPSHQALLAWLVPLIDAIELDVRA